jgi:hypothetical protein
MFRKRISGIMVLIVGIMFVGVIAIGFTACDDLSHDDNSDNTDAEYGWYGNGSASNFNISNFTQLKEFREIVNGWAYGHNQSDFTGKTVTLTADIDLSGKEWYLYIGTGEYDPFNGTFDGNNKTISGLHSYSFFKYIGEDAVVKNLNFVDLNISGAFQAGALAGTNRGKIQNISVNGSIGGNFSVFGGIAADNYGTMENCSFSGSVNHGGGVVYGNYGIMENCRFSGDISGSGGIASLNANSGIIRNCYVTGSIIGDMETGGIVGDNSGTVENCYTTCNINGDSSGNRGGIAGINSGTVKNCFATGNITGDMGIGGVVGNNYGYSGGTIQNCYATGTVTGWRFVGGITGESGTVQNCVALNQLITASDEFMYAGISRVGYASNSSGSFSNNYGKEGMTLRSSYNNNQDVPVTSDANDIHGADVEASEYNTQSWWTSTVNWDFSTVWQWDSARNLPKLRM